MGPAGVDRFSKFDNASPVVDDVPIPLKPGRPGNLTIVESSELGFNIVTDISCSLVELVVGLEKNWHEVGLAPSNLVNKDLDVTALDGNIGFSIVPCHS